MSLSRQCTFCISEEQYELVKQKAKRRDTKISDIIRRLLWLWLDGKIDMEKL